MADFYSMIYWLDEIGVADVLLPFILIFTLVFAILQKAKILGEEPKARKYNTLIALVIALTLVFQHLLYPSPNDPVEILNNIIPNVSAVLVVGLLFLMLVGLFFPDQIHSDFIRWIGVIGSVIVMIVIIFNALGWYSLPSWLSWLGDPETYTMIIVLVVFGLIVWWITGEGGGGGDTGKKAKKFMIGELKD